MSKILLRSALILCLGSWSASAAFAQQVSLTMNNGRVTLKATNATVRQILDEWARVGGTKIVNAEKISGQPVTLTLIDQPEGQALETVLRSAAGYMVSERANPTPTGSRYDRIMLMARITPVTSTPASTAASNNNAYTANGPMPPGGNAAIEGPVNADDDEPPQPTAPVVNPYAQAAQQGQQHAAPGTTPPMTGAPGAVSQPNTGVPGQVPQPGVAPNPGYNSVQPSNVATQPAERFDYANPQKYFQQQPQQNYAPGYPGVANSPTSTPASAGTAAPPPAGAVPGTGAAGTVSQPVPANTNTPSNINPYSPNFNPYNLPAGTQQTTPVTPDRSKYSNPYSQPTQQPQQQPQQ